MSNLEYEIIVFLQHNTLILRKKNHVTLKIEKWFNLEWASTFASVYEDLQNETVIYDNLQSIPEVIDKLIDLKSVHLKKYLIHNIDIIIEQLIEYNI